MITIVPAGKNRFGSLDRAIGHVRRYDEQGLESRLSAAGFDVQRSFSMNKVGVLGWVINGRVLGRKTLARLPLKVFNTFVPLIRLLDPVLPWTGLSLVMIARKPVAK